MDRISPPFVIAVSVMLCACSFGMSVPERYTYFDQYKLGTVTFQSIQNDLGETAVVRGGGDDYRYSLCYVTSNGRIEFLSSELGGAEKALLGFGIGVESRSKTCSEWPRDKSVPKMEIGNLFLGMSKADFTAAISAKIEWKESRGYAHFESQRRMTSEERRAYLDRNRSIRSESEIQDYFDVLISIVGTFEDGRLIDLVVWKTETL